MANLTTTVRSPLDELFEGFFVRPVGFGTRRADLAGHFDIDLHDRSRSVRVRQRLEDEIHEDEFGGMGGRLSTIAATFRPSRDCCCKIRN
jgi:hypothetical protein